MNDSGVKVTETQIGLKISIRRDSVLRQVLIDTPSQLNGVPTEESADTEMEVDQQIGDIPKVSQSTNDIPGNRATISNNNNESEIMDYEYDTNDEPEPESDSEHEENQTNSIVLPPFATNGLSNSDAETIIPQQTSEPSQNMGESDDENISIDLDGGESDVDIEIRPKKPVIKLPPFAAKAKSKRKPLPEPKKAEEKRVGVESIVPNICFPFLYGGCVEMENCYYPHEFPTTDDVYERIVKCGPENAAKLFHVIVARCPSLMDRYFETFVEFFALHLRRDDLAKTIAICERDTSEDNKKEKFRFLIKAFVQSGLSYQLTIRTILTGLNDVTIANITLLLDLRIVNGTTLNDLFEVLEALVIDTEFIFKPALGNFLLTVCNRHNEMNLARLVMNLFRSNNRHRMVGVEDHLLRQFHQKFIQNRMQNGQRQNGRRPVVPQPNNQRFNVQRLNGQWPNGQRRGNNRNRATRGRNIYTQRSNESI